MIVLIKILLGVWFFCKFQPIQDGIDYLFGLLPEKISKNYIVDYIYIALGCQMCLTFWATLIITGDIFLSIGTSMIAEMIKKILR